MNWGWHWRYDDAGNPHKIGIWFGQKPYKRKFYIPFLNQLWRK